MDSGSLKQYLIGQLALFAVYLAKEMWRISKDQTKRNTEDIGAMKLKMVKLEGDLNSAWERLRLLEKKS